MPTNTEPYSPNISINSIPRTPHEIFLVQQMVAARWRIQRLQRLELALLSGAPGDDAKILAKIDLALLDRLRTSAERSYYKAHQELTAARQTQALTEATSAAAASAQAEADFFAYLNAPPPELSTPAPTPEPTRRL